MAILSFPSRTPLRLLLLAAMLLLGAASAQALPTFDKVFAPDTIGPGSTSLLTFTIDNGSGTPVVDLAFIDVLPAGVTIASPGLPDTTCATGTVTAPDGGGTITFSGGSVGIFASCTLTVQVTSSTLGNHMNVSGDLTSSLGNSGPATDDLTVTTSYPGFSKSFSPDSGPFGTRSTLTFTIDNSANPSFYLSPSFADVLPSGMVVADPSNASTDCPGVEFVGVPGSDTVSTPLSSTIVPAGNVCTATVDVVAEAPGALNNSSGELMFSPGGPQVSAGFATDTFTATATELALIKSFDGDPVLPGATVDLDFRILNRNPSTDATGITFTDDLDATLSGLAPSGPLPAAPCGGGSSLSFVGGVLTLSNGSLAARSECTFSVNLLVPAGTTAGGYPNVTTAIEGTLGGPVVGNVASDTLFVSDAPTLTKTFLTNPVGANDTATMEFTIQNNSSTSSATDITFQDNITQFLSSANISGLPASGFCGAGSVAASAPIAGEVNLIVSGANLAASASCTFTVDLLIAAGTPAGVYTNTTSEVSATVDGETRTGSSASDDLTVVAGPMLNKTFTDDPVLPGGTVTLEFTLEHDEFAPTDATSISFSDDLNAALTGLAAVGLPMNDVCGTGSTIAGTTNLVLTGGTLAPGASCTFSVTQQVPFGATPGDYTNTTSLVTSTVSGVSTTSNAASDVLTVTGLEFSKEYIDDPALPGGMATLRFTINNNGVGVATSMFFTDSLTSGLTGLSASTLPGTPCGPVSTISGTTTLIFSGGSLVAGDSCSFDVVVDIPVGAVDGNYGNTTSNLTGTLGGPVFTLPPAFDVLEINSSLIQMTKTFTNDPVQPGDPVTLQFDLTNLGSQPISNIQFTDDLGAALTGLSLSSIGPNTCGFLVAGSTNLLLQNGSLAALASCSIQLTLAVPAGASPGSYLNTTNVPTGTVGAATVSGNVASDSLLVVAADFSKAFDGPTVAGGTAVLTFTIENLDAGAGITGFAFNDDLDAVLTGLTAVGLPMNNVCGVGSQVSGTSLLTFTGGDLPASGVCSFPVTVQVPAGTAAGTYPNLTSVLSIAGLEIAGAASDDLVIEPPPTFAKSFLPNSIGLGQVSTLTFNIDNSTSVLAASSLAFTDNLPAGTAVAATPSVTNTCGGSVTATAGSGSISLGGAASVAAGASCTISVDVEGTAVGGQINTTGDLTSSSGNSGTATDTLVVVPQPTFTKAFAPMVIPAGTVSTLTFTIDNTASTLAASSLDVTDNLPAAVTVAATPNVVNTCGGVVTATAGSGVISLSGGTAGAGASCTVSVDVTSSTVGSHLNTTGNLSSSQGDSGTASATLTVATPPTFAKVFAPDVIPSGGTSTLTFTIDNSASAIDATGLDFTDNLPAAITVATPSNGMTTCTGGTLTAVDGSGTITYAGGTVTALSTCTVSVDVTSSTVGAHVNLTGNLTSNLGDSGTATDTLTVPAAPLFAKVFWPDTIPSGGTSTLTFTIDNTGSLIAATGLDFTDNLPAALTVATPSNGATTCTGGTLTAVDGSGVITYTGGTVPASSSCTVSVDVTSSTVGVHTNLSGNLTSSLGDSGTSTDDLVVPGPPAFAKAFAPNAIPVAGISTLTFTVDNTGSAIDATALDFTDNLPAAVTVAATPNVVNTCGGTVTAMSGTSVISLTGGTATAAATCSLSIDVTSSTLGDHVNLTGGLTSNLGDSGTATDTLTVVPAPTFAKVFSPDLVGTGGVSVLTFTIDNTASVLPADSLAFIDNLPAAVEVSATPNVANTCGGTMTAAAGSGSISLAGGTAAVGATCQIMVDVVGTAVGSHVNLTGDLTSTLGNSGTATDTLDVVMPDLELTKTFQSNPVLPGGFVDVEYTVTNLSSVLPVTGLTFTDDYGAALTGLAATALPPADSCGTGSTVTGTSVLTLANGTLAPSASCTFMVTLRVPVDALAGSYPGATSTADGTSGGAVVMAPAATATLDVAYLEFSKFFDGPVSAGGDVLLTFVLANPDPVNDATGLTFTDDLDAVIPGLVAVGLPVNDVCGIGSQLSGTSVVQLVGGIVAAGGSCTFDVTVAVPTSAASGTFTNVTSALSGDVGGSAVVVNPAAAEGDLEVNGVAVAIPVDAPWALLALMLLLAAAAVRGLRLG